MVHVQGSGEKMKKKRNRIVNPSFAFLKIAKKKKKEKTKRRKKQLLEHKAFFFETFFFFFFLVWCVCVYLRKKRIELFFFERKEGERNNMKNKRDPHTFFYFPVFLFCFFSCAKSSWIHTTKTSSHRLRFLTLSCFFLMFFSKKAMLLFFV